MKMKSSPDDSATSDDIIRLLQDNLSSRLKKLELREEEVTRREKSVKDALKGAEPSDVIHLNVGGRTNITVLRRTLTIIDGSMLAAKFSGKWDDCWDKDQDGNIFIDQDPDLFLQMLNFLRGKAHPTASTSAICPEPSPKLDHLLEYYGLTFGVYPFAAVRQNEATFSTHVCGPHHVEPDAIGVEFGTDDVEFHTYFLGSCGHDRNIVEYEIIATRFTKLQVGWHAFGNGVTGTIEEESGVGKYKNSWALDATNNTYLGGSSPEDSSGARVPNGASIRCQYNWEGRCLTWWVNGIEEVAESVNLNQNCSLVPFISLTGQVRVQDIKYQSNVSWLYSTQSAAGESNN